VTSKKKYIPCNKTQKKDIYTMYEKFLEVLQELGGVATNKLMLEKTGWEKVEYLSVRDALVADKKIKLGKGRGGSVQLIKENMNAN
jgi:hypothetical protein